MSGKNRYIRLLLITFVTGLTLFSCNNQNGETSTLSSIPTTTTNINSPTLGATTTTALVTKTPNPSQTPLQTLGDSQAETYLLDLIQYPKNCSLPCWWGISPATSSLQDAQNILMPLYGIAKFNHTSATKGGDIDFNYPSDDILFDMNLGLTTYPGEYVVEAISFNIQAFRKVGDQGYEYDYRALTNNEVMSKYSLSSVLLTYGLPSEISIGIENNVGEATAPDFFYTWLLYPQLGIFVRYTSLAFIGAEKVESCPSASFMDLWLVSPDGTDSYKKVLSYTSLASYFSSPQLHKSIEEAVNLTIPEFYQTFTQMPEKCLVTDSAIWPGPK